MKIILAAAFALLCSTETARAEPVTAIIAAVSALTSAISAGAAAIGTSLIGATAWGAISGFLASPFGSLIVGIGLSLASTLFTPKQKRSQNAPTTEAGKVNVRMTEPERWLCCGRVRQGGGAIFGEFDQLGNFWYIVVHCDSTLEVIEKYYFDDVELTLDAFGIVQNHDFSTDADYNSYTDSGAVQFKYFYINTRTFTESNPTPPRVLTLDAAFPSIWTDDHKLVGTSFTVVQALSLPIEHRQKIYRWRGPFGLGEPSVSVVGIWSKCYDPRDVTQNIGDRNTWKPTTNSALIWAWFRTHPRGRGKSMSSINWDRVAEQANICDQIVFGLGGLSYRRYECGIAIPESKERAVAEQEILMTCDGQLVFDDDGKCWPRVGYYYAPSLSLTRNRDIVGMDSVEAQSGESESQGVIVRYIDPEARYSVQPAAAWYNPFYYVPGETPKFLSVDILGVQNHNQAMRLAKAIGMRSQSQHKLLPTVSLRGLRARQERIVNIQYDNTFSGVYEIATTVEVDAAGIFCGFGAVPVDANRWDLLPGEERPKSVIAVPNTDYVISLPTGVNVIYNVATNRIEATFAAAPRPDWRYRFQYRYASGEWTDMIVQMNNQLAYSGAIGNNLDYEVRWQTVSSSGKVSEWASSVFVNTSPLTLSGVPVTTGEDGEPYGGFTISVANGVAPYLYSVVAGTLPPGISLNTSTGSITGTPTTPGVYSGITIQVNDNIGNFKKFPAFTITIAP